MDGYLDHELWSFAAMLYLGGFVTGAALVGLVWWVAS